MKTINAQTIINEVMQAIAIAPKEQGDYKNDYACFWPRFAPWGFEDLNESDSEYPTSAENAYSALIYQLMTAATSEINELFMVPNKIRFQTAPKGFHTIQNCKENLQRFADLVRKNSAAFGGGLIRESKPRPAVSWPSKLLSLWKQSIEDNDYQAALDMGARLGALFFTDKTGAACMQVAPVPIETMPGLVTVLDQSGKYAIVEPISMRCLNDFGSNKSSRQGQIDKNQAMYDRATPENKARVLSDAESLRVDQSAIRAQWMSKHGLIDESAIVARIEENAEFAREAVASVISEAVATIAITEAMAHDDDKELVTCESGESESQSLTTGQAASIESSASNPGFVASFAGARIPPVVASGGMDTPAVVGTEYRYAMVNRPFSIGTVPKDGFMRIDARPSQDEPHHAMSRHGIAVYSRQLSDKETKDFELAPIADNAMLSELCAMVYADMVQYADGYIGMASKRWTDFQSHVMQTVNRLTTSYRVSIPNDCDFADMVLKALAKTWATDTTPEPEPTPPIPPVAPSTPPVAISEAEKRKQWQGFAGDIPASLAQRAFTGVSMSPERRGADSQNEYGQTMAADYETMHAQAIKGGTLELLPEVFARYRARQSGAFNAYLASSSRCVSSFIAGPSNFPAARMNKRSDIAHKRLTEYLDGGKLALQAAIRTLRPDLRAIMAGDADAIDRLTVKIESAERAQNQMKAANKAIRSNAKQGEAHQVAALMDIGFSERQSIELIKPDYCGRIGFASYQLTNNNANIRRMKERLEQISKAQAQEVESVECSNGVTLEDDAPANRVRLYFPGKPSEEIRDELKSSGFRWAPSVGAWQAYRNYRTLATAKRMAGEPVQAEENDQDAAPEAETVPMVESEATPTVAVSSEAPGATVAVSTGFEPVDCDYEAIDAACKAMRKASESSAKEQAAKDHDQALIDLPLQYPQLRRSESKYAGGKLAAVNARILLKQAFKGIKFSVTSDYNSLRIVWTDGPTDGQVNEIVGRFDIGASDAQSDYFYTVRTAFSDLFGGVQYLRTKRETSDTLIQQAIDQLYRDRDNKPTVQDYRKCTGAFDWNGSNYENRRMRETMETISK